MKATLAQKQNRSTYFLDKGHHILHIFCFCQQGIPPCIDLRKRPTHPQLDELKRKYDQCRNFLHLSGT